MDVRLSPEQRALRDTAVQLVDRLAPRAVAQIGDPDRVARLDAALDGAGWRDLRGAVDDRGTPLASAVEVCLVAEELARGSADAAFLGPLLAAELRRLAAVPAAEERETVVLDAGLAGPAMAVDGVVASDAVAVDAQGSRRALVLGPTPAGFTLAQVALPSAEVGVDLTRPAVVLAADTKALPVSGGPRLAADEVTAWTAFGLALSTADLVGAMRGALDLACRYAGARRQYGALIGSFQAIQHLLADALVAIEGSRSVALHAAWSVDACPPDEAVAAAAVAKAYSARAARQVCEAAIQVHGGIGNTWECFAHVHLRRALLAADVLGGEGPSLERVLGHRGIGIPGIGEADGLR